MSPVYETEHGVVQLSAGIARYFENCQKAIAASRKRTKARKEAVRHLQELGSAIRTIAHVQWSQDEPLKI